MDQKPFFLNHPDKIIPQNFTSEIFSHSDSLAFHSGLTGYKPTPVFDLKGLAKKFGVKKIFVKDESFRFGLNAFKGLGASYAIYKVLEKNPDIKVFCTATDGNHGRAVAWSARLMGKESRIFVPKDTTLARIEAIKNEGAVVEKINANYEETCAHAKNMSEINGWTLIQDTAFEDYEEIPAHIMAGYFTHFRELEDSLHTLPVLGIDLVFLQSGVGSWPAAAAWYYANRYGKNGPKLVIVEPIEAAGALASFKVGKRNSPKGNFTTIMAGLNCGIPSTTAWEILKNTTDFALAIEDRYAEEAMRRFYFSEEGDQQITSGESGAAGFAGFIALMTDLRFSELKEKLKLSSETRVLFYSTEGATDPENFQKIIQKGPVK